MWAFIDADFIYDDYFEDATFRNSLMSEFFNLPSPHTQLNNAIIYNL